MAYKIYLSPSDQINNPYATGGTNEMVQCDKIARAAYNSLTRCGFSVKVGKSGDSMSNKCRESDAFGADIHMPIHTNATANHTLTGGTMVMLRNNSSKAQRAGNALLKAVGAITPGKDFALQYRDDLYELNTPKALAVYLEVEFHDTTKGSNWIRENIANIGEAIAKGMCDYFGVKYKAPDGTTFIYNSGSSDYDGPVMIGHARSDSFPKAEQVDITEYTPSTFGAQVVIRAKNRAVARAIATAAKAGCDNNKIGYSQATRKSLYEEAKKVNYDLSRIEKECEADCASFAWLCAIIGCYQNNIDIPHGSWPPCTSTMRDAFKPYHDHFEFLDSEQYLTSTDYIQLGDIIVKEWASDGSGHAAVVVEGADGGGVVIKINVDLLNIKTTSAKASITVIEKRAGIEEIIKEADWFKTYSWTYELERLSTTKIEQIGTKNISVNNLKGFTLNDLVPTNTSRLKIAIKNASSGSDSDKIFSQGFIFSTQQDYPGSVESLIFTLEKLDDSKLLSKNCTISFKAPNTWGDYANKRQKKGYRVSLILNGKQVTFADDVFTFGASYLTRKLSLKELAKNVEINYKDTLQIGVQSWVKDEQNNFVFDQEFPKCSQPIYLKFFLNDVDKMHLKINNSYKRAMLLNSKLKIN
jgi:N-acetylmuramoyl-L-alanine amidase